MDSIKSELAVDSSALLMSLLSEPIFFSWQNPKENANELVPGLKSKPPIYKKIEENSNEIKSLDLNLYTITECSSGDSTECSEFEKGETSPNNEKLFQKRNINDIDTDINDTEKQTDMLLKDLQKEQIQLSEIVNDIDNLFKSNEEVEEIRNDDNNVEVSEIMMEKTISPKINKDIIVYQKEHFNDSNLTNFSTYSDIVSILEQLEQENNSRPVLQTTVTKELSLKNSAKENSNSDCKNYSDLLSYLDSIDQNCVNTLQAAKQRILSLTDFTDTNLRLDSIPKLDDLLRLPTVELANHVIDLTLRVEDKTSSVTILKSEITKLNKLLANNESRREGILKHRLLVEKNRYEPVIKRHQAFIDQLIADKKELNERCEGFMRELKGVEGRYARNAQAQEQRHKIELRRCKEMHEAAEKTRREKWMEAKTAKIKELTAKSVEHDIVTLSDKYHREISGLQLAHKTELEQLELRAARKTQQQCEQLREQLTAEREVAIAGERDALRQRFERLVEGEERGYQEQRRRLREEHEQRLKECQTRERAVEAERDAVVGSVRQECDDRVKVVQRRCDVQINNMKETLHLEMDMWKNNYVKQQNAKLSDLENQIREGCRKDRDREIELVIDKLERESEQLKRDLEQESDNRLRRLKEKYEKEMKTIEKSEHDYIVKYDTAKQDLMSQEKLVKKFRISLSEMEEKYSQAKKIADSLTKDKKNIRENLKHEFVSEIKKLKNELIHSKNTKETELQQIYTRVKISIARKDEQIQKLTEDNITLHEKSKLLENLLEQQRKDNLIR